MANSAQLIVVGIYSWGLLDLVPLFLDDPVFLFGGLDCLGSYLSLRGAACFALAMSELWEAGHDKRAVSQ